MQDTKAQKEDAFGQLAVSIASLGWTLYTNKEDKIVAKKNHGINGYFGVVAMAIFVIFGLYWMTLIASLVVIAWIVFNGSEYITVERTADDTTLAKVSAKKFTTTITKPQEMVTLLQVNYAGFRLTLLPAVAVGIVCFIAGFFIYANFFFTPRTIIIYPFF
ncbi:MAG: hypothetical protein AAFQ07_00275 [Chloroflexota bacterium]